MSLTVKNQHEYSLYYTFREIGIMGQLSVDQNGSDLSDYESKVAKMSEENQDSLTAGTYGNNLYVAVQTKAQGQKPVTLTVTGTDQADASATKDVVIPANTQVGQCVVVPDPTQHWKTITSVLVKSSQPSGSEPTPGTQFSLLMFPQKTDFVTEGKGGLLSFNRNFGWKPGNTSKPIYEKYGLDHYKRQRAENTLNLGQMYTAFGQSLEYLRDRDFTLLAEGHEDGTAEIFEKRFFSLVRLNVNTNAGNDGAELETSSDGNYREMFVVE